MGIQNYTDLTLEKVKVDGGKLPASAYAMSNNHGNVTIKDSTINASANGFAFDVFYKKEYADGVDVSVTNSTINGKIEVAVSSSVANGNVGQKHNLSIDGGVLLASEAENGGKINTVGNTTVKSTALSGNVARNLGGAIYNKGTDKLVGALTIENVNFDHNKAVKGGAIYSTGGSVIVNGTDSFTNNEGTAIYSDGGKVVLNAAAKDDKISFTNNIAANEASGTDLQLNNAAGELTGKGSVVFGGSIGGDAKSTLTTSAATVSIADASKFQGAFSQTAGETSVGQFFGGDVAVEGGMLTAEKDVVLTKKLNVAKDGNLKLKGNLSLSEGAAYKNDGNVVLDGKLTVDANANDFGGDMTLTDGSDVTINSTGRNIGTIIGKNASLTLKADLKVGAAGNYEGEGSGLYVSSYHPNHNPKIDVKNLTLVNNHLSDNLGHGIYITSPGTSIDINAETVAIDSTKKSEKPFIEGEGIAAHDGAKVSITATKSLTIDAGRNGIRSNGAGKDTSVTLTGAKDAAFVINAVKETLWAFAGGTLTVDNAEGTNAFTAAEGQKVLATYRSGMDGDSTVVIKGKTNAFTGNIDVGAAGDTVRIEGNTTVNGDVNTIGSLTFNAADKVEIAGKLTGTGKLTHESGVLSFSDKVDGFTGEFTLQNGSLTLDGKTGYFGGNVIVNGGTLDVTQADKIDWSKTTLANSSQIIANTEQFFENGLGADGTATGTGKYTGLTDIKGGTITFSDGKYNLWYAGSATEMIERQEKDGANSVSVVFTGDLVAVDHQGAVEKTEANVVTVADANRNYVSANHAILSQVTLDATAADGKLTVGRGEGTVLKSNLGFKDIKVAATTNEIIVNDNRTLTLVGTAEGGDLLVGGNDKLALNVGTDGSNAHLQLGAAGLGLKGTVNADVTVGKDGSMTVVDGVYGVANKLSNAGIVTLKGQKVELSARDLMNAGTIDAGEGLLKVSGTLDNAAGKITVKNLAVANGADENIEGLKNLTVLDAGAGNGFTTAVDRTLDSLKVENGGKFTGKALNLGQLDNAGTLSAGAIAVNGDANNAGHINATTVIAGKLGNDGTLVADEITVKGEMTNAGTLTATTLNVKDGSSKNGTLKADVLNVAGTFELGDKATVGEASVNEGAALTATTLGLNKLAVAQKGQMTATTLTVADLANVGTVTATTLNVKNGSSQNGTLKANALNVSGAFELGDNATVGDAAVQENATLTATTLGLNKLAVAQNGQMTAEALTVADLANDGKITADKLNVTNGSSKAGELKANVLNVAGKFELGDKTTVGEAAVNEGASLTATTLGLNKLAVAQNGQMTAEALTVTDLANDGTLTANTLNVKNGSSKAGELKANVLNVAGKFELGDKATVGEASVNEGASLTATTLGLNKLAVAQNGQMTAEALTVADLANDGKLTADKLNVTNGSSKAGELKANVLNVAGTFELGDKATVGDASVNEGASLTATTLGLNKLAVAQKGQMTATDLTVADLANAGTVTATTLNVKNGSNKDGMLKAEVLNVTGAFELGNKYEVQKAVVSADGKLNAQTLELSALEVAESAELNADSLTVASGFDYSAAGKLGALRVKEGGTGFTLGKDRKIAEVTVDAGASLTAQALDAAQLKGEGTLTAAAVAFAETNDLSGFKGAATIKGGEYALDDKTVARWFAGKTTIADKASVNVTQLANAEGTLANMTVDGGSLTVVSGQIFSTALSDTDYVDDPKAVSTKAGLKSGTLTFVDGKYNVAYASQADALIKGMKLVFTGSLVSAPAPEVPPNVESKEDLKTDDINKLNPDNNVIFDSALDTSDKKHDSLVIGSTSDVNASADVVGTAETITSNVGVSQIKLPDQTDLVAVNSNRTLTLIGTGANESLIATETGATLEVGGKETGGVLALGVQSDAVANAGTLNVDTNIGEKGLVEVNAGNFTASKKVTNEGQLVVKEGAALAVGGSLELKAGSNTAVEGMLHTVKDAKLNVETGAKLALNGVAAIEQIDVTKHVKHEEALVTVGDNAKAGKAIINKLGEGAEHLTFFLDPIWQEGAGISDASSLALTDLSSGVTSKFIVGQNSVLSLGATTAVAEQAFADIAHVNGKTWGRDITAAAYIDKPFDLGTTGGIIVDGTLLSSSTTVPTVDAGTVAVNGKGMMIVNQDNVKPGSLITTGGTDAATVAFAPGAYLAIVNAKKDAAPVKLANTVTGADKVQIVTDNPFFSGAIATNTVTTKFESESGLAAIASTGIQSMARRADFVMSETVANRTSLDQQLNAGVNLWVDVTGERYEADKLDNNGSFRSDAGYAMFGGDIQLAEGYTAGLALQYGDASVRSDISSIKNSIKNYGLTAYAGQKFGDAKVVGELAWLKSENKITASQTAMNQKLDVNVYSAGVRAQYELAAGGFKFVPSIGLRVSLLETDDMTIGTIKATDSDLTYVQMPISLRISGGEVAASGWTFAPSLKVAYVPTFGDKEIKVYGASQDVLDMSPVQADFGLRGVNGNLMFNQG